MLKLNFPALSPEIGDQHHLRTQQRQSSTANARLKALLDKIYLKVNIRFQPADLYCYRLAAVVLGDGECQGEMTLTSRTFREAEHPGIRRDGRIEQGGGRVMSAKHSAAILYTEAHILTAPTAFILYGFAGQYGYRC